MEEAYRKFDLAGKSALVTGGATGIGYFMAKALAQSGAAVTIAARREDVLQKAAEKLTLEANGNRVRHQRVDLNDHGSIAEMTSRLNAEGGVDIYVGNAAQFFVESIDTIKDQSLAQTLQVNVTANIQICRDVLPLMRRKKWGRIIFSSSIASIGGTSPQNGLSAYSTVKGALNSFVRAAATETGHDGITVNSIILGPFLTELWVDYGLQLETAQGPGAAKAAQNALASMTALGRLARCDEVEGMVQLLASDAGSYITGACLALDGGSSMTLAPNPTT